MAVQQPIQYGSISSIGKPGSESDTECWNLLPICRRCILSRTFRRRPDGEQLNDDRRLLKILWIVFYVAQFEVKAPS